MENPSRSTGRTPQESAFRTFKKSFTTALILIHFDHDKEITIETDTSDYVSPGIMSQYDESGTLHPVAFFCKKHSPAECNYDIYDKKLMAIVWAFDEWHPHLDESGFPIQVLSDHKNVEYL